MPALGLGEVSNCANPKLDIITQVSGSAINVSSLEFAIFEKVTDPLVPVQVFPPSGRETVVVGTDCPTGGRISTGHYVAVYTVDVMELVGTHEIRWYFTLAGGPAEQEFREDFEVLPVVGTSGDLGLYTTVVDMRAEGVTSAQIDDAALTYKITEASRYIDKVTGRWFYPRTDTYILDGSGDVSMLLEHPIISITTVSIEGVAFSTTDIIVYNRHLTANMTQPDDRENPKFELNQPLQDDLLFKMGLKVFPRGQQNMTVVGTFGYTDYDGSPGGVTPLMISQACKRLVARQLGAIAEGDGVTDLAMSGFKITELRTRDQWIRYGDPNRLGLAAPGPFTGDREIDNILMTYRRPPRVRSV